MPTNTEPSTGFGVLCGSAIFLSAFLLFALEPLTAKKLLPWFGGSAAVWSVCLVFYQVALLGGYYYARWNATTRGVRTQFLVHAVFLIGACAFLPIGPEAALRAPATDHPSWLIFSLLAKTIGLPFVVLSATSPLLQSWIDLAGESFPYRFFALSNFASLAALIAYPMLVEPAMDTRSQTLWWSGAYLLFTVACGLTAWNARNLGVAAKRATSDGRVPGRRKVLWFALAGCGSALLLAVTNHIDENVAAVPLLWILPLSAYLGSFIVAFTKRSFYRPSVWLRLLAFALGMMAYAVYNINEVQPLQIVIPIFLVGLFICCVFCHGELNRLRPEASHLTTFYLIIAAGGAAGAILVGLVAPYIFSGLYEMPLSLLLTAGLAFVIVWPSGSWPARLLWATLVVAMCMTTASDVEAYHQDAISLRRSFYGSLRVVQSPHAGPEQSRTLFHGTIEHGAQFILPPGRNRPTTYYGPESGVGIVLRECFIAPKRVGVIGLGVGTVAAYGKRGDTFRFYEINRQVTEIAESLFFYLRETLAEANIAEGDGRILLEKETAPPFDVLVLDAFSGDAIPVHLLTQQAMAIYRKHLRPDGVLAFHISNNYLNLGPIVFDLANASGFQAVAVHSDQDQDHLILASDWVLVTNNEAVLHNSAVRLHRQTITAQPGLRLWTDAYNSLWPILKTPQIRF